MEIAFPKGTIDIFHKSQMGSLKDVFKLGNKYLVENDEEVIRLDNFLKRPSTKKYIANMIKKYGYDKTNIVKAVGRGRGAVTYANIQFII
jgi:glycerol-3-phosphate cytidylyltransferase-like family protein